MLPVWWVLGISGIVLSLCTLPLIAALVLRRRILVPRGFGLYLVFLLWCVFSATQLASSRQAFSSGYRGSLYLGAGLLFLYVLNASRADLPPDRVVGIMAGFFVLTVVGGVIGMIVPNISFTTVARGLVPPLAARGPVRFRPGLGIHLVGTRLCRVPIYRPKAPFIYANEWGGSRTRCRCRSRCAPSRRRGRRRDATCSHRLSCLGIPPRLLAQPRRVAVGGGGRAVRDDPPRSGPQRATAAGGGRRLDDPWRALLRDAAGRDRDVAIQNGYGDRVAPSSTRSPSRSCEARPFSATGARPD